MLLLEESLLSQQLDLRQPSRLFHPVITQVGFSHAGSLAFMLALDDHAFCVGSDREIAMCCHPM